MVSACMVYVSTDFCEKDVHDFCEKDVHVQCADGQVILGYPKLSM